MHRFRKHSVIPFTTLASYFGHSGTRKIGRLLEMVATGKLVSKDTSTGHHRDHTAALHDDIAPVAAVVVKHYGDKLSSDFK
jgi:hypothetical protein